MRSFPVRRRTTCSYLSWVRLGVSWMARINIGPPFRECGRRADGLLLLRRPDLAAAAGDLELGRHRLPGVGVDMGEDRLARGDLDSAVDEIGSVLDPLARVPGGRCLVAVIAPDRAAVAADREDHLGLRRALGRVVEQSVGDLLALLQARVLAGDLHDLADGGPGLALLVAIGARSRAAARNQQGGERQEGQRDTLQGHGPARSAT